MIELKLIIQKAVSSDFFIDGCKGKVAIMACDSAKAKDARAEDKTLASHRTDPSTHNSP